MNLLRRAVDERKAPNIVAMGCEEDTVNNIMTRLKDVLHTLVRIARLDIGEAVRAFIDSLHEVAAAV